MRILVKAKMCTETFNAAVKDGTAGPKMQVILEGSKAETVYFTEESGVRTAIMAVNIDDPAQIPSIGEPWFIAFNADVSSPPAMSPEDLVL
jgi:hypothetical protein